MTKVIKKSLLALFVLMMMTCLLVGLCFRRTVDASTTSTTITFDGDYTTTDTPAYAAVGGITAMGGGIDSTHVPGAWHGRDWSELTHPAGVDGKCIGVAIHPWEFVGIRPVVFNTPITVTEGMNSMTFRLYTDLSTSDTYGLTYTKNIANASAGIWIYALDETGLLGEGVMIPFNVTQGEWIDFVISGEDFDKFVDNGVIKGFKVASGIVNGGDETILKNSDVAAIYIDTITFGTVETNELKDSDFTNGKATLFTGKGDYDYAYGDRYRYNHAAYVNGATQGNYSTWGCGEVYPDYGNINTLTIANVGAHYSFADMKAGSNDGYALAAEISGFGLARYRSILFNKKIKASEVGSLTFRLFASLDSSTDDSTGYCGYNANLGWGANDPGTGTTPFSGIFFYSPDSACGYNEGVKLNPFVKQHEWTEVTLSGEDLVRLADKDGYISGLRIGSAFMSGDDVQLYGGWTNGNIGSDKYDLSACVIIDDITVSKASPIEDSVTLFNGNDGAISKTVNAIVEGNNIDALNTAWAGNGFSAVSENFVDLYDLTASGEGALFDLNAVKQGSANGHALGIAFNNWGYTVSPTVNFGKAVKADDVKSLVFRIYANISSADTYGKYDAENGKFAAQDAMQDTAGIFIYPTDKNAKGTGYLVKANVKQREWIDLVLCKEDLLKLADNNGMISGFRFGAGLVINQVDANDFAYMYAKGAAYDQGNVIFVDSVTALKEHPASDWITDQNPTHEEAGSKHKECLGCGEILETAEIPAGHSFGEWIAEVPAKIGVAGTKGHYHCSACNKDFDAEETEIENLVIPALNGIKYASLSLNGDIGVNFYAYVGGVETLTANDGALSSVKQTVEGVEYFKFTINVAAKDYKNDIAIAIDGTDISVTYNVETYIDAITDKSSAYALVQALKVYCESARAFFAGETPVATGDVDIADANALSIKGEDSDISLVGATLILESKTEIKVYFKTANLAGKTFTVGESAVVPVAVEGYKDLYMITVENISAVDLDTKYVIVIGGYTVNFSALSYAYAVVNDVESSVALMNVAKALYNYNVQADAYASLQG